MFYYFTEICKREKINFDESNQRVRCLGHIINLAAQKILKNLKAEGPDKENDLLNDNDNTEEEDIASLGTIGKVII